MTTSKTLSIRNMTLISMFTAILAILTQISFMLPGNVPMTLQTFAIALIGIILGPKLGAISVTVYLLLGMVGLPVFSNFHSGPGVLFGPTGGYLIGFLFMVIILGFGKDKKIYLALFFAILGLLVCHASGLIVYYLITKTFLVTTPIILIKDIVTIILAIMIGNDVKKRIGMI